MEELSRIAFETVMRACGFGCLAIFCIMFALSFAPHIAFKTGGLLALLMTSILVFKAYKARNQPYRRTELWLYLPKELRPPEQSAQQTIAGVMRATYLTFAYWSALLATAMLSLALIFSLFGHWTLSQP